jgi:transcriptional regulator with XRE-family HTH domain
MTLTAMFPNHLAKERAAQGLSREELAAKAGIDARLYAEIEEGRMLPRFPEMERLLAALGGIEPGRLFDYSIINTIGDKRFWNDKADYKRFYDDMSDAARLLVSPDEMLWLDREAVPDRAVDVFLNMSCSTQYVPHVMLDLAAVLKALGVRFQSGSGRLFCCGTYYRRTGKFDGTDRMNAASVGRTLDWGAKTAVHFCTQCVNTFSEIQRRQRFETGMDQSGVVHTQVLRFLDERLTELGDGVPWKTEVRARVLAHGHSTYSWVHARAKRDVMHVARHIPGVEFVGSLDRISLDSFCDSEPGVPKRARPKTRDEVAAYRRELAAVCRDWGADTVSPQHQTCLQMWQPFASETVRVRHVISLLAEALGVGHPDRYHAASRLGDTDAIVEQTRPIWSQWGMTREKASAVARAVFDPAYQTADRCECGRPTGERCGHAGVIGVDVLTGVVGGP